MWQSSSPISAPTPAASASARPASARPHHLAGEFPAAHLHRDDACALPRRCGGGDGSGGGAAAGGDSSSPRAAGARAGADPGATSNDRYPERARYPVLRETVPGFVNGPAAMTAFVAPAGTPPAAIARWNQGGDAAFAQPALAPILAQNGFNPIPGTPEALSDRPRAERAVVASLVRASASSRVTLRLMPASCQGRKPPFRLPVWGTRARVRLRARDGGDTRPATFVRRASAPQPRRTSRCQIYSPAPISSARPAHPTHRHFRPDQRAKRRRPQDLRVFKGAISVVSPLR